MTQRIRKICSIEGCGRTLKARGWCALHYGRWQTHGDPNTVLRKVKSKPPMSSKQCSVYDCDSPAYCRTFCTMHYTRWKVHGDPLKVIVQTKAHCKVEGCDKMQHAHDYCASHLYRFQTYGDPLAEGPGRHKGRNRMETPTYDGMHKRIFYDRGKATQFTCVDCDNPAQEWSYDGGCPNELYEVKDIEPLAYSTDQSRYSPRCKRCHRHKDRSLIRPRDRNGRFAPDLKIA